MPDQADRIYRSLLVLRCQAGDSLAFEELVKVYRPGLFAFLQRMIGEISDADDLFQEVWLDVFKGISKLNDPEAFPAWLYQVARHRAFREWQKGHRPIQSLENIDPPDEPECEVEWGADDAEHVHASLGLLKPEHREVLLLRFLEDMSYEDIAQVVGCQLGTVRSRIHYAKLALRRLIERTAAHE